MKSTLFLLLTTLFLSSLNSIFPQEKNLGTFVEPKEGFYQTEILKSISEYNTKISKPKKYFQMDFTGMKLPQSITEFNTYWHNAPISQGNTSTCWAFSTTSFLESEVYRIHNKKVKLSEMFTVYWEYVEKAKRFIRERGNSYFPQGSEANAVTRIWARYGILPAEAYTGKEPEMAFYDHDKMFDEMNSFLQNIKITNAWDEEESINTIKSILNFYMVKPPTSVTIDGKEYTPKEFLSDYIKINPDDYVDILSYMQKPFYKQVEYEVPDNWWHSDSYYNVPLDIFMVALKSAIKNGYTVSLGGDVSEPGYSSWNKVAVIPTFDIPSEFIDDHSRQFRFSNRTTTDDHGIHVVGFKEHNGVDWFLIKDSAAGSRNTGDKGYYFYHQDYIKLKMMDFMVHKDAVKDLLEKFNGAN